MPSALAFVPHGRLPRLPWLSRLVDFVDSHFGHQRSVGPQDPDTDFPATVPLGSESTDAMNALLGIGLPDDEEDPPPGTDQHYFLTRARRQLEPVRQDILRQLRQH